MGERTIKFDQKSLATLKPCEKTITLSDPKTPGLVLRVTPTGTKVYYLVFRMGGRAAKKQWLKLGNFEDLPLNRAQERARAHRVQAEHGEDPVQALKDKLVRGMTLAKFAETFEEKHCSHLAPKTLEDYKASIRVHILPALGEVPVAELDRDRIEEWHSKITKPRAANLALAVLSTMLTRAMVTGVRPEGINPCKHIRRNPEIPRARDIRREELIAIGKALRSLRGEHSPWALAAIEVAALCWGRISEILELRRDRDCFLDDGYAIVHQHKARKKMGAKTLELVPQVVEILKSLPKQDGNPYFFVGVKSDGGPLSRNTLYATWREVCRVAKVKNLHIHDFRSLAASEGEAQGVSPKSMSHLLGHTDPRTVQQHYIRVRQGSAARIAQQLANPIAEALEGRSASKEGG